MQGGLDDVLESLGGFKLPPSSTAPAPDLSSKADEDYLARREAATAPAQKAIETGIAKREALMSKPIGAPKPPQLADVPKAPDSHFQDPMQAFQNPAVVLATLASLFTRAPLTAAMNAAGSAMEGFHAGDVERVKLEREKWKDNLDAALKQNGIELEKYRAAMDNKRFSQTEKMAQMQAIAAGANDQIMLATLRAGNPDAAYKVRTAREKVQFEMLQSSRQEADRQEREKAQRAHEAEVLAQQQRHHEDNMELRREQIHADPKKEAFQRFIEENPDAGSKEIARFMASTNQPRSGTGIALQRFIEANPNATPQEVSGFMGRYGNVQKAMKDFGTGRQGQQINSLNVGISHLETLRDLSTALHNGNYQRFNQVAQQWAAETGNPAPTNFDTAKEIVSKEVVKALVAGGGGVGEREEMSRLFSSKLAPQSINGVVDTAERLLAGQFVGLKKQYEVNTSQTDFEEKLTPQALGAFKRLGGAEAGAGATAEAPAAPPGWSIKRID